MIIESYLAIKKRLSELLEIAQVDWFYDQYSESADGNLVYVTPAVYVEFQPIEFQQRGGLTQTSVLDVVIHVVSSSGYGAEDMRQTQDTDGLTIQHLTLVKLVHKKLQGFGCAYNYLTGYTNADNLISGMVRRSMEVDHALSPFVITKMTFQFHAYDCDAAIETTMIAPNTVTVLPNVEYFIPPQ